MHRSDGLDYWHVEAVRDGEVVDMGKGDDLVDALLNLIPHMSAARPQEYLPEDPLWSIATGSRFQSSGSC